MPNRCAALWNAAWALSATTISRCGDAALGAAALACRQHGALDRFGAAAGQEAGGRRPVPCSSSAVQPTTSDWISPERRERRRVERVLVQEQPRPPARRRRGPTGRRRRPGRTSRPSAHRTSSAALGPRARRSRRRPGVRRSAAASADHRAPSPQTGCVKTHGDAERPGCRPHSRSHVPPGRSRRPHDRLVPAGRTRPYGQRARSVPEGTIGTVRPPCRSFDPSGRGSSPTQRTDIGETPCIPHGGHTVPR